MSQMDHELTQRKAAIVETIDCVEELIQCGMGQLNRLANQIFIICKCLEKKDGEQKTTIGLHGQLASVKEK